MKYLDIRTKLNQACHDRHASTPGSNALEAVNSNEDFVAVKINKPNGRVYEVYTRIENCAVYYHEENHIQRVLYQENSAWKIGKIKNSGQLQCNNILDNVTPEYQYLGKIQA